MSSRVYLRLGEVADEWQEALDTLDAEAHELPPTEDEREEARAIIEQREQLCRDLGGEPVEPSTLRWLEVRQGMSLIAEASWEDYCRDWYEGVYGEAVEALGWAIDWTKVANSMRQDYYTVEYDGETYYRRA